jgi:hypothetical protein
VDQQDKTKKAPPAKKKLSKEQKKKQWEYDLKDIMKTAEGRRFVWGLLSNTGIFRGSFAVGDAHATSFNEGRRSIGLKYFKDLHKVCPGNYHQMVLENGEEEM